MSSIQKSDIDKNFGKILREFRIKNNLTQEELSEKLGISLKYISRIENGYSGIKNQTMVNYINTLGIIPNLLYSPLISNPKIKLDIELSNKISKLSEDKKLFLNSIVDLLNEY